MIISEIRYNQAIERLRFDADYYKPKYIGLEKFLKSKKFHIKTIKDLSIFVKKGIFDISPEKYKSSGIPLFRVQNIRNIFVNTNNLVYIAKSDHIVEKKTELEPGDILISKVGTIGNVAMITNEFLKCNFSQNVIGIKINKDKIISEYLTVYLNTRYGRSQLEREQMYQVQSKLELESIKNMMIVLPTLSFQQKIESYVKESYKKRKEADEKYKSAEELLNKTLGIERLELKKENIFETRFDEVETSQRFDTDYYLPKFTEIVKILKNSGFKNKRLKDLYKEKVRKINPLERSAEKFNYVEIGDVDVSTGEIEVKTISGHEAPPNARRLLRKGDLVISMVRPTRKAITIIPDELDNSIGSSAFYILEVLSPFREFLLVYLRSPLGLNQLGRPVVGAMYPTLKKEYVEEIIIPAIPEEKQNSISNLITQSFSLRKEAKKLLEKAKKEVEKFIENNAR